MHRIKILFSLVLSFVILYFIGTAELFSALEDIRGNEQPVASVMIGSSGIYFSPKVSNGRILLTVSAPDGTIFQKKFDSGSTPYLGLSEVCKNQMVDGHYTYELRVSPGADARVRNEDADLQMKTKMKSQVPLTQTGHFLVQGGIIVTPKSTEKLAQPLDVTHADDVVITGGLCVGYDCLTDGTETFGNDTIKLKDIYPRLFFDDTSSTSSFPANDWRILINDITDGGANYFAVEDSTSGDVPFKIEAGAPSNSLYVEDYGRVGLGTSVPAVELHIVSEDTPTVRLDQVQAEQTNLSAQVWEIAGNESNFFIRDITNSSKIPFKIQPGSPSNALCVKNDGKVGLGTESPGYPLEVDTTGENSVIVVKRTDGATNYINATNAYANFGSVTNHPLRLVVNSAWKMRVNTDGSLTMSNGASLTTGGVWTNASSRALKENIQSLTTDEALHTLNNLNPVKFNYKADNAEKHVGFIAEDAPELVATKDKKGMSPMDVVAVLTKVVQEQQKTITQLQEKIAQLEKNR